MKRIHALFFSLGLIAAGMILLFLAMDRPGIVVINGQQMPIHTRALSIAGVLRAEGITLGDQDRVYPAPDHLAGWFPVVQVQRASLVQLWLHGMDLPVQITSHERIPANLLAQFGVHLFPGDLILWNGQTIQPDRSLPQMAAIAFQYRAALPITLYEDGQVRRIFSAAPSLGEALWQNGIHISTSDQVSSPLSQPVTPNTDLTIQHSQPVSIFTAFGTVTSRISANTVGQALAASNLSLQGVDQSIPAEESALPAGGGITLVHVREELILEQQILPYSSEFIPDPETELDQERIISSGHYGLEVARWRVRYEDDVEVSRALDSEWTASQAQNEQIGYGTLVVPRSISTPAGVIEYWRAVNVYATSYSPCNLGTGSCNDITASGAKLTQGIIAVTSAWYRLMRGQRVYIPGYGFATISDVGGGIPGREWIDLGYTDETYVPWHSEVTLYFLTPIPTNIPYTLP